MNILNSDLFINMLVSASNNLENKKEEINRLNVFPVPDGDTGTNMSLTFSKATKEKEKTITHFYITFQFWHTFHAKIFFYAC